jgi:hypothetical protein
MDVPRIGEEEGKELVPIAFRSEMLGLDHRKDEAMIRQEERLYDSMPFVVRSINEYPVAPSLTVYESRAE